MSSIIVVNSCYPISFQQTPEPPSPVVAIDNDISASVSTEIVDTLIDDVITSHTTKPSVADVVLDTINDVILSDDAIDDQAPAAVEPQEPEERRTSVVALIKQLEKSPKEEPPAAEEKPKSPTQKQAPIPPPKSQTRPKSPPREPEKETQEAKMDVIDDEEDVDSPLKQVVPVAKPRTPTTPTSPSSIKNNVFTINDQPMSDQPDIVGNGHVTQDRDPKPSARSGHLDVAVPVNKQRYEKQSSRDSDHRSYEAKPPVKPPVEGVVMRTDPERNGTVSRQVCNHDYLHMLNFFCATLSLFAPHFRPYFCFDRKTRVTIAQ